MALPFCNRLSPNDSMLAQGTCSVPELVIGNLNLKRNFAVRFALFLANDTNVAWLEWTFGGMTK